MNKRYLLLALLIVALAATGIRIRTFDFNQIDLGDLAVMAVLTIVDFVLWLLWKRLSEKE